MPDVADYDNQEDWMTACVPTRIDEGDEQDQAVAVCISIWENRNKAMTNPLKTISRTDDELVVGNYIVLFGGRDLEGVGSAQINEDGSKGEYFTPETALESKYTKTGALYVDWEHGAGELDDELLGVVNWKTKRVDDKGVFVHRVLSRRNQYVQWLDELGWFDDGTLGTSSEADPSGVQKAADGAILRWPLEKDTITVQPMEPRMLSENQLRAFKALGIPVPEHTSEPEPEPTEAGPEGASASVLAVGKARAKLQLYLTTGGREQ